MNGLLGGLVSVTASCNSVAPYEAILIGVMGAIIVAFSEKLLERLYLDDAVGAIPVHLCAGVWGTLAVGIFANPDVLGTGLNRAEQIGIQALGVIVCFSVVFISSFILIFAVFGRLISAS